MYSAVPFFFRNCEAFHLTISLSDKSESNRQSGNPKLYFILNFSHSACSALLSSLELSAGWQMLNVISHLDKQMIMQELFLTGKMKLKS